MSAQPNRTHVSVSIVVPAYNEEATIGDVVRDFIQRPEVHEVVVVDNNCADATAEQATAAGARVIAEPRPGYGQALRAGLQAATGDILVMVEADGSFRAGDLPVLLGYLRRVDMVLGSRTHHALVQPGANMGFLLRRGNSAMARFLGLLWFKVFDPSLTDVGCTYRAFTKDAYRTIREDLRGVGPEFSPEMMCAAFRARLRVLQVPVAYGAREGGDSSHSDGIRRQAGTAWRMLRMILSKRFSGRPGPSALNTVTAE